MAFAALSSLNPNGDWTTQYKPLKTSTDLQLPRRELDEDPHDRRLGKNKHQLSWIWLVSRSADENRDMSLEPTEEEVHKCEYI